MSVTRLNNVILIQIILNSLIFACLPALASSPEAIAQKTLCHTCLAKIYVAQRKFPEAILEYQTLLTLTPNDARLHFDYAGLLVQSGKIPLSVPQYKAAAHIQPNVPEYQSALGAIYLYTKNYEGAVAAYTKACQLGGQFEKQLQTAQEYQAQAKQLIQYNQKLKQTTDTEDE